MRLEEEFTIYARINEHGGPPIWKHLDRVKKVFAYFKNKHIELTIREQPEEGTNQQLRYLFGVVVRDGLNAFIASGNRHMRKKHVYEILLGKFAPDDGDPFVDKATGEIHQAKKSLSMMSKQERSQFIEESTEWLMDYFGINIDPPPEKEDV